MTDTPKQPATEAGRALLADYITDDESGMETMPDDIAERILAIEAEAAASAESTLHAAMMGTQLLQEANAGLLALREAAKALDKAYGAASLDAWQRLTQDRIDAWHALQDAIDRTAPAAAEIEARIDRDAYLRGWADGARVATEPHPVLREQPATDEAQK